MIRLVYRFSIFATILVLASCSSTFQKRRYQRGYYFASAGKPAFQRKASVHAEPKVQEPPAATIIPEAIYSEHITTLASAAAQPVQIKPLRIEQKTQAPEKQAERVLQRAQSKKQLVRECRTMRDFGDGISFLQWIYIVILLAGILFCGVYVVSMLVTAPQGTSMLYGLGILFMLVVVAAIKVIPLF